MPVKKCVTVEEALAIIFDDSDVEGEPEIDILPADDTTEVSDTEEIDENQLDGIVPVDVCGELDIFLDSKSNTDTKSEESHSEDEALTRLPKKRSKVEKIIPDWKKRNDFDSLMEKDIPKTLVEACPSLVTMSPFEIFLKIIDPEYLEHLVEMTNLYAQQKLFSLKTNADELVRFFGILIFSGYHRVPEEDHYWSTAEDLSNAIVPNIMSRKRFREIKTYFHLVDNLNLEQGKAAKIAPFYRYLSTKFLEFGGVFCENLSIDESMVPYYGHHSCKMFIRGKPIRFGYKIWMMCSPDGFPFSMQIYTGSNDPNSTSEGLLGTRVVNDLTSVITNPKQHSLYFDNFFSSYSLLVSLRERGFRAIGTVRENRTNKCPLKSSNELRKQERGDFDYRGDGKVVCVRWHDNSVVTVLSNWEGALPTQSVTRYSRKLKRKVPVKQPRMIGLYNQNMGGVDVLDRLLGSYRPVLRSKKWWWNLFANGLNMAVVAAWRLHCHAVGSKEALSHLDFRREIATVAMKVGLDVLRKRKGGPTAPVSMDIITSSSSHCLSSTTQGRCSNCQKNTKKWCEFCGKRMHEKCFQNFHKHFAISD